jgi:hypothetical protein
VDAVVNQFLGSVPRIVGALVILIVGWIIARIIAAVVSSALRRTGLDKRIARLMYGPTQSENVDVAPVVGRAVFYLVMLFVLVAVFQELELSIVTTPLTALLSSLLNFVPSLIGAGLLLLLAWILATILRAILVQGLRALRVDERVGGPEGTPLSRTLGEVAYYLVFLFFLPAILSALGLTGLLGPVQNLLNSILGFLPHLISAAIIVVVGVFIARLIRNIVSNLLAATGIDGLSERIGLGGATGGMKVSNTLALVVYVFILIPVITSALDTLQLGSVTQPISNMLNRILVAVPNIFAAAVVLVLAVVIGRVVGDIVANILTGVGFNALPAQLGIGMTPAPGARTPANVVGTLVQVAIVLLSAIEALDLLGFTQVATLAGSFITLGGQILLGVIIFGVGLFLARIAADTIRGSGTANAGLLAGLARGAILILTGAMALREMGVANEIINLAFGLIIGAVAVAAAIAFGVGGREVAGRELERFMQGTRGSSGQPPTS